MKRTSQILSRAWIRRASVRAVVLAAVTVALGAFTSAGVASAEGQFTFLQKDFTQELYGTAPNFFGGVAFAPNTDVWVDFCTNNSSLDRFDNSTTTLEHGSNVHPLVAGSPFASKAGCGLTNNPDGFLYSNESAGVVQINASTAAPTGVVFGGSGNGLGIATDPQTKNLVYVAEDGTILIAAPGEPSSVFSKVTTGSFIDGIAFDPTGNFLFASNRTLNVVTIIARNGELVQNSSIISGVPDGISFHASPPRFVVTNNNDGSMTRLDFTEEDFTKPPVLSVFASGGFRGDLTQVGPDGCIYLTQEGTRYDDGTTSFNNSIVRICPGFAPPPGVIESTETSTSLSGGGQSGEKLTVPEGTAVTDQASLKGKNVSKATGTVEYKVYSDTECKTLVADAGTVEVTEGKVPPSDAETLAPGTYYWQASYSGDNKLNEGSKSECGAEVETVERGGGGESKGRMTGGGRVRGTSVHHGFVLHCDKTQAPNRLQVNWGKGNKFHLTSLTSAECNDDPNISEGKPVAGFDTYRGSGTGKYNGTPGATAQWVITDAGEPGTSDTFQITIRDATNNVVLSVSGKIRGNQQAHPN